MSDFERPWHRAQKLIGQQTLTNSKHPRCFVKGVYPTHVKKGHGCKLVTLGGQTYIDFICGLGTNLLGYGNPYVTKAVLDALDDGVSHSLPSLYELSTAEKLKTMFPFVERVKFLKTGTEACMAAVRMARAYTGRKKLLTDGYHGWSDMFVSLSPPADGVADSFQIEALSRDLGNIDRDVAAVIVEPVIVDDSIGRIKWLHALRQKCDEHNVVLIFDEVITGFRYKKFGVSNCYGTHPDLLVLGKAMGNGLPISAVCGHRDILDNERYFVSSTYAGDTVSLAAAAAVISTLQTNPDYNINTLISESKDFQERFNVAADGVVELKSFGTRGLFTGDDLSIALFFQESVKAGILFGKSFFTNFHHPKEFQRIEQDLVTIFDKIRDGDLKMEGEMPTSPFATQQRERNL